MRAWLLERYRPHIAVTTALLFLVVLWSLVGLVGYGLYLLVLAALEALIGVLS